MKKAVIVTGAAGNLGQDITTSLLDQGYQVYATLGPNDNPEKIAHEFVQTKEVNLLDPQISKSFIKDVIEKEKEIEAIICVVGGFMTGDIYNTSIEDINKMIHLNFNTAYNVVQPLLGEYKNNNDSLQVIFIGSRPALNLIEGQHEIAYSLAKSLLSRLAEFINISTNETGVSASLIVPSTIDTPGTRSAMPDKDPSAWVSTKEIANVVKFILSDAGKMMREPLYKIYNRA